MFYIQESHTIGPLSCLSYEKMTHNNLINTLIESFGQNNICISTVTHVYGYFDAYINSSVLQRL